MSPENMLRLCFLSQIQKATMDLQKYVYGCLACMYVCVAHVCFVSVDR